MKNENENDIGMSLNDFNSENQSIQNKTFTNKIKIIIGISALLAIIFFIIIITIIFVSNDKDDNDTNIDDQGKITPELITADIICKYNIQTITENIHILGYDFNLDSNIEIYINDKKIKNTKTYQFSKKGENKIKFLFYNDNINLSYMFKDINSLT